LGSVCVTYSKRGCAARVWLKLEVFTGNKPAILSGWKYCAGNIYHGKNDLYPKRRKEAEFKEKRHKWIANKIALETV